MSSSLNLLFISLQRVRVSLKIFLNFKKKELLFFENGFCSDENLNNLLNDENLTFKYTTK